MTMIVQQFDLKNPWWNGHPVYIIQPKLADEFEVKSHRQ